MHLWNDGESSIRIHDMYQRGDAACFIDMIALVSGLAEGESAVTQTLCILHDPHVLMLQVLWFESRQFTPATLGQIDVETLCVKRDFQYAFTEIIGYGNRNINLAAQEGI